MSVLDVKILRDLWSMRVQVASIALLVAAGVAVFVMSSSNYLALVRAMEQHYGSEKFADLFASLKRAPLTLVKEIREIDGVAVVEPRIAQAVRVIREDTEASISGRVVSLPAAGEPMLNRLRLLEGRTVDPLHPEEVVINVAYAQARSVRPGDGVEVVLNGRLQRFRVVGVAYSPEFVFATRAALPLPDDRNFVVLWAGENALASAFDMQGAFNDLTLTLAPGARERSVVDEIDRLLAPYGGTGTYGRRDLPSHRFLEDELAEQKTLSVVMPGVFFGIAAFLLNVVIGRLVEAQRGQIASLKALGFADAPIVMHYVKMVSVIAIAGSLIGIALGWWLTAVVIEAYRSFFKFPVLEPQPEPWLMAAATCVSLGAANAAAAMSVRRVARLAPAEAMRPEVPAAMPDFSALSVTSARSMPLRYTMPLRSVLGRPVRTLMTTLGIALALPLVMFGLFWFDAIDYMIDVTFSRIERGDAFLVFSAPVASDVAAELRAVPGVVLVEVQRVAPVRLHAGHRSYLTSIVGLPVRSELKVPRDKALRPIPVPVEGVMLSRPLAMRLGVAVGDDVTVEVLEGKRPRRELTVQSVSDDVLGFSATMELSALNRLLREGPVVNAAALRVDPDQSSGLWRHIQRMPKIEASSLKALWLTLFNDTIAGMVVIGAVVLAGFGMLIAVGVVYNSARITLQERAWELASLRILGFTKGEVSTVLLTELAIEVAIAVPAGLWLGRYLIGVIASLRANESFQIPAVIDPGSYVVAALLVAGAAVASAIVVRLRINSLDLVAVLKTRD